MSESLQFDRDSFVGLADRCMRRVLKAEWVDERKYYCMTLECGHHGHGSESYLKSPILCMSCFKEYMGGLAEMDAKQDK